MATASIAGSTTGILGNAGIEGMGLALPSERQASGPEVSALKRDTLFSTLTSCFAYHVIEAGVLHLGSTSSCESVPSSSFLKSSAPSP